MKNFVIVCISILSLLVVACNKEATTENNNNNQQTTCANAATLLPDGAYCNTNRKVFVVGQNQRVLFVDRGSNPAFDTITIGATCRINFDSTGLVNTCGAVFTKANITCFSK